MIVVVPILLTPEAHSCNYRRQYSVCCYHNDIQSNLWMLNITHINGNGINLDSGVPNVESNLNAQ